MKIRRGSLEGLYIVEPQVIGDERGFFLESYHDRRFKKAGIDYDFVQDNLSSSARGTLRGLHFQVNYPQAKLVQAITGEIFDVAVDIRPHSPTFGKWSGVYLSESNKHQLLIPEGFAHGFCVISETAQVAYKCSDYYHPEDEGGILWSDPVIGIEWPVNSPIISEKDKHFPMLSDLPPEKLYKPVETS
jgi:dTDP-4-dehydrorhamnose 3,5-epimerase